MLPTREFARIQLPSGTRSSTGSPAAAKKYLRVWCLLLTAVVWISIEVRATAFDQPRELQFVSVQDDSIPSVSADDSAKQSPLPRPVADKDLPKKKDAPDESDGDSSDKSGTDSRRPKPLPPLPEELAARLQKSTPLNPESTVYLDRNRKKVILRTEVACTNCVLEMLCVPEGTKEHECILRIRSQAYIVHTALLALGLEPGKAAIFSPEFKAPSGPIIQIQAVWQDQDGKVQSADIRSWVRHNIHKYYAAPLPGPPPGLKLPYEELRYDKFNHELLWFGPMTDLQQTDLLSKWDDVEYQKIIRKFREEGVSRPMKADFVFVGSQFYTDPDTGEKYYTAEGGYLICLANFADALLDIREPSSSSDGSQVYEAWTEHIPAEGTAVLLELTPVPEESPVKDSELAPPTENEILKR